MSGYEELLARGLKQVPEKEKSGEGYRARVSLYI
jgi:hypothetical protein